METTKKDVGNITMLAGPAGISLPAGISPAGLHRGGGACRLK
jgi:hypothetical protein